MTDYRLKAETGVYQSRKPSLSYSYDEREDVLTVEGRGNELLADVFRNYEPSTEDYEALERYVRYRVRQAIGDVIDAQSRISETIDWAPPVDSGDYAVQLALAWAQDIALLVRDNYEETDTDAG